MALKKAASSSFVPESSFQDDGSAFGLPTEFPESSTPDSPREVELGLGGGERSEEKLCQGQGGNSSDRRPPRKEKSRRSSTQSLQRQRAVTRQLAKKYWEKLDTLDRFAVQPEPASRLGAGLTIFVWGATIIYLVIAVYQWMHKAPIVAANSDWSIVTVLTVLGKGPFLMLMECHARSGCLVSSNLPVHEVESSNGTKFIDKCVRVPYLDSLRVPMVYTEAPQEGVSVIYDPSSTDDKVLPRFGVTTLSEIKCEPEKGKGCVDYRGSAAGPGVSQVTIVRIVNQTEVEPAKHRLLAFSGMSTMNETVNNQVTPCRPDPGWKEAAQSCLKMAPVYFDVLVYNDGFWLYLWGSAGGAYSSFFEICTVLLILYAFTGKVYRKTLKGKMDRLRQVACVSFQSRGRGQAYAPETDELDCKKEGESPV